MPRMSFATHKPNTSCILDYSPTLTTVPPRASLLFYCDSQYLVIHTQKISTQRLRVRFDAIDPQSGNRFRFVRVVRASSVGACRSKVSPRCGKLFCSGLSGNDSGSAFLLLCAYFCVVFTQIVGTCVGFLFVFAFDARCMVFRLV